VLFLSRYTDINLIKTFTTWVKGTMSRDLIHRPCWHTWGKRIQFKDLQWFGVTPALNLAASVNDTGGKLPPVSTKPVHQRQHCQIAYTALNWAFSKDINIQPCKQNVKKNIHFELFCPLPTVVDLGLWISLWIFEYLKWH